jgi:hypothetical protein
VCKENVRAITALPEAGAVIALLYDVSQSEAEQIFFNDPLLVVEDVSHSVREFRLQALVRTDAGRLLHISFTLRRDGRLIRVISARTMHRKERLRYEHEA